MYNEIFYSCTFSDINKIMYEKTIYFDSRGQYRTSGTRSQPNFVLNEDSPISGYYVEQIVLQNNLFNIRGHIRIGVDAEDPDDDWALFKFTIIPPGYYSGNDISRIINNLMFSAELFESVNINGEGAPPNYQTFGWQTEFRQNKIFAFRVNTTGEERTLTNADFDDWRVKVSIYVDTSQSDFLGLLDIHEIFNVDFDYPKLAVPGAYPLITLIPVTHFSTTIPNNPLYYVTKLNTLLDIPIQYPVPYTTWDNQSTCCDFNRPKFIHLVSNLSDGNLSNNQFKFSIKDNNKYNNVIANIPLNNTNTAILTWDNKQTIDFSKCVQQQNNPGHLSFKFVTFDLDGQTRDVELCGTYFCMKIKFFSIYND